MSMDQCHSTVGHPAKPAAKLRAAAHSQVGVTGRAYWRGLDDAADVPEFREWLEREFPAGASMIDGDTRRTFLKLMGASVALAGAATIPGCRRPDHKIMPYSRTVPEEVIPGKALYYATSMPLPGGGAEGLLVETHEGRPTKVEGNPLHPTNRGKSSLWSQASILELYDPDRLKDPIYVPSGADVARSWQDVSLWTREHFEKFVAKQGQGLVFLTDRRSSPALGVMQARVEERFPKARWFAYDAAGDDAAIEGSTIAFGRPMREVFKLENADVIVTLDRDLLMHDCGGNALPNCRGFAARRKLVSASDTMNRLYAVESSWTVTGAKADHRLRLSPSQVGVFAVALAKELLRQGVAGTGRLAEVLGRTNAGGAEIDGAVVAAIAKDLLAHRGRTLIAAGPTQSPEIHALVHALNSALGNVGSTVSYRPLPASESVLSSEAIAGAAEELASGRCDTIVCINVNPVYDAPASANFAAAFAKARERIVASVGDNETVAAATWRLPLAHALESWGDTEAVDGTLSPIQPMIAPLFGAKSELELLGILAGDENVDGYEIVRTGYRSRGPAGEGFEAWWRRSLHNGVFVAGEAPAAPPLGGADRAAQAMSTWRTPAAQLPGEQGLEVVFTTGNLGDGRFANCAWLQEIPDPVSKIAWDNAAMVSPATAERLGIEQTDPTDKKQKGRMIRLVVNGAEVTLPAWAVPGIAENTVVVPLGYGRTVCGHVGTGVGFNAYPIASGRHRRVASRAKIERAGDGPAWHNVSTTQSHGSMEGRAIVRESDLAAWSSFGADPFKGLSEEEKTRLTVDSYGNKRDLNFAERLGELSHTPANINAYTNPQRGLREPPSVSGGASLAAPSSETGTPPDFARGPQWGMSIDLNLCIGCNVCTVACQAENNIPVVGKIEVNKGREMHWIRVDRYFTGHDRHDPSPEVAFQPVACVHCENAPCETVCPVNATVHGPEGMNYMVYNRCIGTRYCANNCPYKVRRFNFFDYGVKKLNGEFIGKGAMDSVGATPANVNLIPPRLRERLDEITKLQMNPDVTVRSRGVMEKCTYCVQRVNEARIESKLKGLNAIPDGMVQTACQQACPTDAIVFGDIYDTTSEHAEAGGGKRMGSRVRAMRDSGRTYSLLGFLNTRPRTTYMLAVRNPNPELADADRKHMWEHPFEHGQGSEDAHEHAPGAGGGGGHTGVSPDSSNFDQDKAEQDSGYRLSLSVLGAHA